MSRRAIVLAVDAAAVLLFVIAGRGSHDEGGDVVGVVTITAPFFIGLAVASLFSPHVRLRPWSVRAGIDIWLETVVIGMLLRRLVWDRGTALSFVLVTTVVLGVLVVGWRAIWSITRRQREIRSALPPS